MLGRHRMVERLGKKNRCEIVAISKPQDTFDRMLILLAVNTPTRTTYPATANIATYLHCVAMLRSKGKYSRKEAN